MQAGWFENCRKHAPISICRLCWYFCNKYCMWAPQGATMLLCSLQVKSRNVLGHDITRHLCHTCQLALFTSSETCVTHISLVHIIRNLRHKRQPCSHHQKLASHTSALFTSSETCVTHVSLVHIIRNLHHTRQPCSHHQKLASHMSALFTPQTLVSYVSLVHITNCR